jgi:putative ABC transport system permease protein
MFWYYLKTAIRNLWNNKKFSIINITGFAFGISICLAIVLFLVNEYSCDRYHEHTDQIVRVIDVKNKSSSIDYRVKDILLNNYPEIENGCLVQCAFRPIEVKASDQGLYLDNIMSVDNSFFEVFTIPFLTGNSSVPFTNINSAVITESTAKTLFGTENPVGKEILFRNNIPLTVTAVIKDFPENSSFSASILVNAENEEFKFEKWIGDSRDLSTYRWPFRIYLQLNKKVNRELFLEKINSNTELLVPYVSDAGFLALKDIYLFDPTTGSGNKRGNPGLLKLLGAIAFIILSLAIINYINLTVAQQNKRNKDTGVKKTIGANRSIIFFHFLSESVLVSLVAFALGIFLAWILLPVYNAIFSTTIDINYLFHLPNLSILICTILLIGILSGSGPAIALSGINPVKVLSGSVIIQGKKNFLRNFLTVFQFTISIILIFCVIIVQKQIKYVKHKNPGFNEEQLVRLDIPAIQENEAPKFFALIEELRKSPYISNLSTSYGVPGSIPLSMGSNMENTDKNMSVPSLLVDTAFLETFAIQVIKGRNLEPGDFDKVCMINEAAWRHFEFENLENKRFNNFGGYDIVGVVNDFHFRSLHDEIGPVCIIFTGKGRPTTINVRFASNGTTPGMDYIRETWKNILPGFPLKYQFYDEWFDSMYRSEERFAKTIGLFAVLAIVISCIGILGLAIFSSERRTKEIGIRKVNGATVTEVVTMLNKDFVKWVAIAFIVAVPASWYAMDKWLESFAYKTSLSWWIFALAGLLALGIALLTVSWQSWRAATRNPVEALRYE